MTIHNLSIHKIGKVVLKEAPKAIQILDETYKKLQSFSVLRDVRLIMVEISKTRMELTNAIDNAAKVCKNKGMVKK